MSGTPSNWVLQGMHDIMRGTRLVCGRGILKNTDYGLGYSHNLLHSKFWRSIIFIIKDQANTIHVLKFTGIGPGPVVILYTHSEDKKGEHTRATGKRKAPRNLDKYQILTIFGDLMNGSGLCGNRLDNLP